MEQTPSNKQEMQRHQVTLSMPENLYPTIASFLKNSAWTNKNGYRDSIYDSLTELHISGHNSYLLRKCQTGEQPNKVSVYFENNSPHSVHVEYFDPKGQNLDIYINGKALKDLLSVFPEGLDIGV